MILRNRRSGRKVSNRSIDPSEIIFKYLMYGFQIALVLLAFSILTSCSSAKKQRMEERERVSAATGFYCQFINGDQYSDFEVVINLEMAKRCDATKPFSISDYKSAADIHGLLYCCSMKQKNSNYSNEVSQRSERPPRRAKVAAPPAEEDSDELDEPAPIAPAKAAVVERPAPPSAAATAATQSNSAGTQSSATAAPAKPAARPAAEAPRSSPPVMEPPPRGSAPTGAESGE